MVGLGKGFRSRSLAGWTSTSALLECAGQLAGEEHDMECSLGVEKVVQAAVVATKVVLEPAEVPLDLRTLRLVLPHGAHAVGAVGASSRAGRLPPHVLLLRRPRHIFCEHVSVPLASLESWRLFFPGL